MDGLSVLRKATQGSAELVTRSQFSCKPLPRYSGKVAASNVQNRYNS